MTREAAVAQRVRHRCSTIDGRVTGLKEDCDDRKLVIESQKPTGGIQL